jgi:hypothetical protein
MADFVFGTGAEEGNFRAGGYHWELNWFGGDVTHRVVEAARLGIDAANEAGAQDARDVHPWQSQTYQTEDSVFVSPARLSRSPAHMNQMWGTWGVHDYPREPIRVTENTSYPQYEGKVLTTKDVALLLEFGFHTRGGYAVQYPWLYPAWDREKPTVLPLVKMFYEGLPSNFRYRMGGTGRFMGLGQVFG